VIALTEKAIDAIRSLDASNRGIVRIAAATNSHNGTGPAVEVETVADPEPGDEVVDADGVIVFVAASAAALADKVLDADEEDGELRFRLVDGEPADG
jgi:Fe-S cluster assembly iron-binding protein IscA